MVSTDLRVAMRVFGVFGVTKHVVEPDEQVQVREQCLHGGLEIRNGIRGTVKNAVRSEDSKRRVE